MISDGKPDKLQKVTLRKMKFQNWFFQDWIDHQIKSVCWLYIAVVTVPVRSI